MNARARIPIAFPNAPTLGQQFTATSGVTYEWDGTVWIDVVPPAPPYVETDPLSVKLIGDTMTGPLVLPLQAPTLDTQATNKGYVDALAAAIIGVALYIGAADASTADCQCTFTAFSGYPNGPLPPANQFVTGAHLIVARAGTPTTGPVAGVALLAGDWLISDAANWYRLPFSSAANIASAIAVTPAVGGQTNVQSALENTVLRAGDTITGFIRITGADFFSRGPAGNTGSNSLRFEAGDNGAYMGRFYCTRSGYNTRPETVLHFEQTCGGYSTQDVFYTSTDSPPRLTSNGRFTGGQGVTSNGALIVNNGTVTMQGNSANAMIMASDSQKYFDFRRGDNSTMRWRIDTNNTADDYLSFRANTNAGTFDQVLYLNRQSWNAWQYGDHSAQSHTNRSDARLKQDIVGIEARDAVNAFAALNPVRYRLKVKDGYPGDTEKLRWGFVADEIEQGAPSAVTVDDEGMKGYDIAQVLAIAVAKIKDLEATVVALQARLA